MLAPVLEDETPPEVPVARAAPERAAPQRIWKRSAAYRVHRSAPAATILSAVLQFVVGGSALLMTLSMLALTDHIELPGLRADIKLVTMLMIGVPGVVWIACGFGCLSGNNIGRIAATVLSVLAAG